jgi:hypothetical protein
LSLSQGSIVVIASMFTSLTNAKLEKKDEGEILMKRCSDCTEECDYYADEEAQLCEKCSQER